MSSPVNWPIPSMGQPNRLWKLRSRMTVLAVGAMSKIIAQVLNTTNVHNKMILEDALDNRPNGVPLITCSNHTSCVDDPYLFGVFNFKHYFSPRTVRWSLAAHDICFTRDWHGRFFGAGKTVPVVRGDGVYQRAMDFVISRLNMGEWVHIFPEGKVNMTSEFLRLKWGIGRLISECNIPPVVIPMWHHGLTTVLPNQKPYYPRIGKKVTFCIGEPMDFGETLSQLRESGLSPRDIRKAITDIIQEELERLKEKAEKLHFAADFSENH